MPRILPMTPGSTHLLADAVTLTGETRGLVEVDFLKTMRLVGFSRRGGGHR